MLPLQREPRSTRVGLGVRAVMIAAIVLGLLGMHVLVSQGSHTTHASSMTVASVESGAAQHHEHEGSMIESAITPAESSFPGVWAVVCVLALLLAALFVAPSGSSWLLGRRALFWSAATAAVPVDNAPQHPPSLTVLSVSRT